MLWSALVGGLLAWLLHPKNGVVSITDRGLQFGAYGVFLGTISTFHRAVNTGFGTNEVAAWLAVAIPFGIASFILGCAIQFLIVSARKIKKDGPEMLGTAIAKTADVAKRVQTEATIASERIRVAAKATEQNPSSHRQNVCNKCKTTNHLGAKFCADCGSELTSPQKCSGCGNPVATGQKFCGHCGQKSTS